MPHGSVKFFNAVKGFGFITSDSDGKDIFVPSASLISSGISSVKPGQRLSYEEVPDSRGPKAVDLKLLAELPTPKVEKERPTPSSRAEARPQLTFYHDHTSDWSCHALSQICAAGYKPLVVEYLITPPTKDELKTLSRLLGRSNQSLVRRYEPLFLELRLDDRFIGDSEFWEAIIENPALINGPLIATDTKASFCHSEGAIKSFWSTPSFDGDQLIPKPKGLSERALRILAGDYARPVLKVEAVEVAEVGATKRVQRLGRVTDFSISAHEVKAVPEGKLKVKGNPESRSKVEKARISQKPKAEVKPKAKSTAQVRPKTKRKSKEVIRKS